jgi:hypothetical protein
MPNSNRGGDHGRLAMDGLTSANLKSGLTRVASAEAKFQKGLTGANLQSALRPASTPQAPTPQAPSTGNSAKK